MTRIVWSPKSIRDLDAIEVYVAQYNPTAAKRLVHKIIRRTAAPVVPQQRRHG